MAARRQQRHVRRLFDSSPEPEPDQNRLHLTESDLEGAQDYDSSDSSSEGEGDDRGHRPDAAAEEEGSDEENNQRVEQELPEVDEADSVRSVSPEPEPEHLPIGAYRPSTTRQYHLNSSLMYALGFFVKNDDGESATCRICKARNKRSAKKVNDTFSIPNSTTSTLKCHLFSHHQDFKELVVKEEEERNKLREKKKTPKPNDGMKQTKFSKTGNNNVVYQKPWDPELQKTWDAAVCEFNAETMTSFLACEKLDIIAKKMKLKIKVRSAVTVSRHATIRSSNIVQDIRAIIKSVKDSGSLFSIGMTSDLWKDEFKRDYMNLSIHFFTPDFKLTRLNPVCTYFGSDPHTGKNMETRFREFMTSLGLNDPGIRKFLCLDNAKNNQKLQTLLQSVTELWCLNHTTQLAVGDFFSSLVGDFDIKKVLEKTQALADAGRNNSAFKREFAASCTATSTKLIKMKLANKTRWNSTTESAKSVLRLQQPLQHMLLVDRKRQWVNLVPTMDEFDVLDGIIKVLEPLRLATKVWEADQSPTLNKAIPEMYNVRAAIMEVCHGKDDMASMLAYRFLDCLEDRVPDCGTTNKLYRIAHVLDPNDRGVILKEMEYNKYDEARREVLELCEEFETHADQVQLPAQVIQPVQDEQDSDHGLTALQRLKKRRRMSGDHDQPEAAAQPEPQLSPSEIELKDYETMKIDEDEIAVGEFWWKNRERFKILGKAARTILPIPVSSSASERAFSIGGQAATSRRSNLKASKVEDLIISKMNGSLVRQYMETYNVPPVEGAGHQELGGEMEEDATITIEEDGGDSDMDVDE